MHERADIAIAGPEHYHSRLTFLSSAASLVPDSRLESACGAVVVIGCQPDQTALQLPLARMLAQRIADRMADEPHRRSRVILDLFSRCDEQYGEWVLATNGDWMVTNAEARRLEPADLRSLSDLATAVLSMPDFSGKHVDQPSGGCAVIAAEGVYLSGELAHGAMWGEVMANTFTALGCTGVVADGCVRGLDEVRAIGFHFFARGPGVSHAYVRVEEVGEPVTVGCVTISPHDLIHADQHGVLLIPREIAVELPAAG